jgi:hypothetical protein
MVGTKISIPDTSLNTLFVYKVAYSMTYPQTCFGQTASRATFTEEVQMLSFTALKYPGEMKIFFVSFQYEIVVERTNKPFSLQEN